MNVNLNERFGQDFRVLEQNHTASTFNISSYSVPSPNFFYSSLGPKLSTNHYFIIKTNKSGTFVSEESTIENPYRNKISNTQADISDFDFRGQSSKCELITAAAKPLRHVESTNLPSSLDNVTPSNSESSLVTDVNTKETDTSTHCFVCNMDFENIDFLEEHRKSTTRLFCRVCAEEFNDHADLDNHIKMHKPYKCKKCKKLFLSKKDLLHHRETNLGCHTKLSCNVCNKTFYTGKSLRVHQRKFHTETEEVFKCLVCGKSVNSQQVLNDHLYSSHTCYEDMECPICQLLLKGPLRMKSHMKTSHLNQAESDTYICSICKKIFKTKPRLKQHMETHDKSVRLCEICGKSINGLWAMRYHKRDNHSRTSYTCKVCKENFQRVSELRKHSKQHKASEDQGVYCEICGKKFKSAGILKQHKLLHSDVKQFVCDICGASFKQKVALSTHQRVHSDVGKYFCNTCGVSFKWKPTFDKHVSKCA